MAIASVKEALEDPTKAISNSNILAVTTLAVHQPPLGDVTHSSRTHPLPSQGPLKSLQFINLYGGPIKPARVHRAGLLKIIEVRGGLQAAGLAEVAFPLTM